MADDMKPSDSLPPETAAAIWRRAAQLQAEAAARLESRSRALTDGTAGQTDDPQDYTIDDVRAAAAEAGISPDFIALALTELKADPLGGLPAKLEPAATKFLGTPERSIELTRRIELPTDQVYAALQRVLPAQPWLFTLRDISGDPVAGGLMVFDLPAFNWMATTQSTPLAYHGETVDVQQIQLTLREIPGSDGKACEILLRAGLQRSVRRNFQFGRWTAGIAGVFGGGAGLGIGLAAMGMSAMVALPVVAGAALVGGGTAAGYRALYRHSLQKLTELFEQMLASVAVHAKTGGAFAPIPPAAAPPGNMPRLIQ